MAARISLGGNWLPSTFEAAILDLDGTLVDTLGDFVVAINLMLQDLGMPVADPPMVERLVGKGSEHLIRGVLAQRLTKTGRSKSSELGIDALYPQAWDAYQHHYRQVNGTFSRVFEGVDVGLSRLSDGGLPLACLTNKPVAFAVQLLQTKGLLAYFSHVFGGDSFDRKKPDPLPVAKTCAALGSHPTRTLMIGDSGNDAQAARAAHCPVILVTYGYNHGEPVHAVDSDGTTDTLSNLVVSLSA